MIYEDLPTAQLKGRNADCLLIQIKAVGDSPYWDVDAKYECSDMSPPLRHAIETHTYNGFELSSLDLLLDGYNGASWELEAIKFRLKIYKHQWGVREGFVTELSLIHI